MRLRPILMQPAMVRQARDYVKTETRRLSGLDEVNQDPGSWKFTGFEGPDKQGRLVAIFEDANGFPFVVRVPCPYGMPGDLLWVRETTAPWGDGKYAYFADGFKKRDGEWVLDTPNKFHDQEVVKKWTPSIHMPYEAARYFLHLTGLRAERVQDITEDGAQAEGAERGILRPYGLKSWQLELNNHATYLDGFRYLWFTINSPADWERNPWVWVLKFRRETNPQIKHEYEHKKTISTKAKKLANPL